MVNYLYLYIYIYLYLYIYILKNIYLMEVEIKKIKKNWK